MSTPDITLYHAPGSRSSRVVYLLEELNLPYKVEVVVSLDLDYYFPTCFYLITSSIPMAVFISVTGNAWVATCELPIRECYS